MNTSLYIAKRYLFSKKSHNAINIISMISVVGVAIATIAMVCTLSVFNGFKGMVADMFNTFDPELKITPATGKVFDGASAEILKVKGMEDIALFSEIIEDNALIQYRGRQVPATIKGVSGDFDKITCMDTILIDGSFKLQDAVNDFGTLGIGLSYRLGVNAGFVDPIEIYAPKRNVEVNLSNPSASFSREYVYVGGIFTTNQPVYDDQVMIVPIELTRRMFDYQTEISALELKLKNNSQLAQVQKQIEQTLGNAYLVKNRYQQQEASFKMMNMEKWICYLMLVFILVIALFNVVSSLTMLIVEKQKDVAILRNLGAADRLISNIFLFEGWMISIVGAVSGIALGVALCMGQQYFGWLKMGNAAGVFVVDSYPVVVVWSDVSLILATVLLIGFLAAFYPVRYLTKKYL